jgi:hypothetical protein
MTFICLNIELRTQPLIILVVIAGTDKRPRCSKIRAVELNLPKRGGGAGALLTNMKS